MDLGTKKKALNALVQVDHLEADIELLKAMKSHSRVLKGKYPTRERHQREVLWELLSVISPADIETNRKFAAAAKDETDQNANEGNTGNDDADQKAKEAAALKAKEEAEKAAELAAAKNKETAEAKKELKVLIMADRPDYQQLKHLVKVLAIEAENMQMPTLIDASIDFITKDIEAAKEELKALVLDMNTNYHVMERIINTLEIETDDKTHKSFVFALKEYRGDIVTTRNPELENELEETKGDLEEKTQELENTQEELEETQNELADTQQQLEEKEQELADAKKNETAS